MVFLENSPQRWVSGSTLILTYASKIAEMNDSDQWLSKTYTFLKIGSVENVLELFKVGEILINPGNPRKFVSKIQGVGSETVLSCRISEKARKVFFDTFLQF